MLLLTLLLCVITGDRGKGKGLLPQDLQYKDLIGMFIIVRYFIIVVELQHLLSPFKLSSPAIGYSSYER